VTISLFSAFAPGPFRSSAAKRPLPLNRSPPLGKPSIEYIRRRPEMVPPWGGTINLAGFGF
jgi:hypothetical protein